VRNLTGEIVKMSNGYIIRTQKEKGAGEVYTILNPDPIILDGLVKSSKIVPMDVRVVSGDNVEIKTIDGALYQ
jgi:hypothetical protein